MDKSIREVNKYEVNWQIVRTSVKGKKVSLEEKLSKVWNYFQTYKTYEAWARSVNWLNGLLLGYKASGDIEAMDKVQTAFDQYGDGEGLPNELFSVAIQTQNVLKHSFEDRFTLYKDLFKYEKNFTSRRYRHNDLEKLVNLLWHVFRAKKELDKIPAKLNFDEVVRFRKEYKSGTSKQKFFF